MNIQLLLTGDELMTGVTVDSNSVRIARALASLGLTVDGKVTIGDHMDTLVAEIHRLTTAADVLIINGGLGPTVDDLTAAALAQAADLPLAQHRDALDHLETLLAKHGLPMNEANLKQAMLPEGADILANPIGSAVGFSLTLNDCLVLCTPGVPSELELMLSEQIVPRLARKFPQANPVRQSRLHLLGIGESYVQQWIADTLPDWPPTLDLGFRAGLPTLEVKITSRAKEDDDAHDQWFKKLKTLLADHIVAEGDTTLAGALVTQLRQRHLRLATAEIATGGELAHRINQCADAQAVFELGVIAPTGGEAAALLGLPSDPGEAGEALARSLAAALADKTDADYIVALCGAAGEGGKPSGDIWVAWGRAGDLQARRFRVPPRVDMFPALASALAMDLVKRAVQGIDTIPDYFPPRLGG